MRGRSFSVWSLAITFIASISAQPVTLLARIGKTISHLNIDPVTLHISDSRILYKPIGEELQVSLAVNSNSSSGYFTLGQHLHRLPLDGSEESSQLRVGGVLDDTPTAISYDWLTNKIYVALSTIGPDNSARIEVCDDVRGRKTDGGCAVILHDKLDYLHSLVLDPREGNMYWINAVQNQIERAFMNGLHHDQRPFLNPASSDGATLTSLALSGDTQTLFYVRTTKEGSELWKCRLYERQSCTQFFETTHVLHLDVHENNVLFSLSSGRLAMCEHAHCEGTLHEIEQISEMEVFQVIHDQSALKSSIFNPCSVNNGGCSHICLIARIEPKRTCACPIGVRLKEHGVTCEDGFSEVLIISAITGLFYVSLDTSDYTPQAIPYEGHDDSSHSLFDVDYDPLEGFVYWLDITDAAIKRCRFDGSDLSVVVKEGVQQSAKTFRLDVVGRNLFWVDGETALIWMGKMEGSLSPRVLDVSIKLENPHGIAIDSNGGVLYITDWYERSSRIVKMNLDGSEAQIFYSLQDFSFPTGIELDVEGGRLYWAESNHSLIRSIKLDATDLLTYMQASYKLVQPYSVSKLGNRIFCNSMAGRSFVEIVLRDGILAGHDSSRVVESQIYGPVGLRAVRLKETAKRSGSCAKGNNGGCGHYCLNSPSGSARCLCARGFELQKDGRRCVKSTSSIILLDGSGRRPDLVRMSLKGPRNFERLHLQDLSGSPHDMAYDQLSSSIYIASSNESSGTIEHVNLTSLTPRATVVVSGVSLRGISHLEIVPHANIIVYSNTEFGRIEASSLDGRHSKTLAWIGIRPTLIKLNLENNLIYYVNESVEISSIRRMPLTGAANGGEILYKTSQATSQIVAIAVNSNNREIYWSEQNRGVNTLHKMITNGTGEVVLFRSEDRRITYLQFRDDALYYIDSKKNEFGFFDSTGFHSVHAGVKSVRDFVITHPPLKSEKKYPCEEDNGDCTELCLPRSDSGVFCTCGDHRFFDVVSKSCQANPHGIIMASNGHFLLISAKDPKAMLNEDHSPITSLPIEKVGLPLSVAVDELSRFATLYWIDANEPKFIRSVPTKGSNTKTTQSLHVPACLHLRALTVDTFGRQLFVSCVVSSGRSHVMVFRIQSSSALLPDKLLHIGRVVNGDEISSVTGKQAVPTELAVGARKLAYLDVSTRSGGPILVVCDLDGRNCKKASERTTPYSRLSLLPRQGKLLFTGEDSINELDLTTLSTAPIPNGPERVKALFTAVDGERVATVPIDEKEDSFLVLGEERLLIPGMSRVTAITSFTTSEFVQFDRSRSCLHQECTHLCTYTGDSYECLCPLGYTISHASSHICMPNITCEPWEFLCRDQRTCVHAGAKCDHRLNCPDGSDESAEVCGNVDAKTWICGDEKTKIDRYLVCDGIPHCDDGSDEQGCKCSITSTEMDCAIFGRMSQPECVLRRLRCDHHYDCSNGADEDERLCSTFSPEVAGFRVTFTHIMIGAIVLLLLLAICPICVFFCYSRKRTEQMEPTMTDRRYHHFVGQNDPSLLVPLSSAPVDQYEMRPYSVVDSTSTYPSLPPPMASQCGSRGGGGCSYVYQMHGRDHPSRFYAPPPSTASLSTYGIVVPSFNTGTLSQRKIVITEHAVPSPSSRSGISPPPAYLVESQRGLQPRSNKGRKTSKTSPPTSNSKDAKNCSRATLNRSHSSSDKSDHDSVSLSSHSSEGAPTSSRNQL
ncbi:hypothetical protein PMAYCL1PPCAC_30385 [Pristionchus mayeri]|uniref:EGF-like domain-containing protein n=1 Tax=Pristionchus mayeri TaxID=1317129 RepID=A0AAN5DDM0_9BILA|nr:hypothetical protein PMAYCL1PPCAC_30385 [Pristionchus mayeri]